MTTDATPREVGSHAGLGLVPERDLVEILRERGNALRCHPAANGTIEHTEQAGELLVRAAEALKAHREREPFLYAATRDAQEFASMYGDEMLRWRQMVVDLLPVAVTGGYNLPAEHSAVVRRARAMLGV